MRQPCLICPPSLSLLLLLLQELLHLQLLLQLQPLEVVDGHTRTHRRQRSRQDPGHWRRGRRRRDRSRRGRRGVTLGLVPFAPLLGLVPVREVDAGPRHRHVCESQSRRRRARERQGLRERETIKE